MIWSQDGDPAPMPERVDAGPQHLYGAYKWPTCRDLWYATAHEQADTVTQILSGNGVTYGLGAVYLPEDRIREQQNQRRRAETDRRRRAKAHAREHRQREMQLARAALHEARRVLRDMGSR